MADYWKSNPRKFCDVCKCWFADNRASIDFHEGGRRHQENVKKKLQEARTRSTANEKERLSIEKTLHAIEHAAVNAYQQDLAGGRVKDAKIPHPVIPELELAQMTQQYLATEQLKEERELEKKKIEANAQQKIQEIQAKALETAYNAYSSSYLSAPQNTAPWQQCYSPEGYIYYCNTVTGVSQWESPQAGTHPTPIPSSRPSEPPKGNSSVSKSTPVEEKSYKRPPDQAELEERGVYQPSKRRGPYGGWTTVAVVERNEEAEGGGGNGEQLEEEQEDTVDKVEEVQFEEKKISGGLAEVGESEVKEFKGFSFKKRTNRGRPKIRQRTSDM